MEDRSDSSSDLQLARALSRRLAGGLGPAQTGTGSEPEITSRYVRFQSERREPMEPSQPPSSVRVDSPHAAREVAPERVDSWDAILAWCMARSRSTSAFVVDSQGFVISTWGESPADGFEGTGAELCFSMEQLQRMDPHEGRLHWIEMDFGRFRIAGFRVRSAIDESEEYILGLLNPGPIHGEDREAMVAQITSNLPNLI